jgi:hypothetical protein
MENDSDVRRAILATISASNAIDPSNAIDVTDPSNAYTVWTLAGGVVAPVFCGGRSTLDAAHALAREHVGTKSLVIMSANQKHGLRRVEDDDRVKSQPKAHPGSGF